jgi:hypothetical protein
MRARARGRILITGSIAGLMPGSYQAVYNGSKASLGGAERGAARLRRHFLCPARRSQDAGFGRHMMDVDALRAVLASC